MKIRAMRLSDRPQWETLYRGYAEFYKVATDATKLQTLFGWLMDSDHVCEGIVAMADDDSLVGFAHFRAMPSPLRGPAMILPGMPSPQHVTTASPTANRIGTCFCKYGM